MKPENVDDAMRRSYEQGGEPMAGAVYISLREQVARRMYDAAQVKDPPPGVNWPAYRQMADEVIRLMEWPRRGCDAPDWADRWDDKPMRPLTLPPDDWKP